MILLSHPYAGYAAGTVASLQTNVEAALIAQNRGVTSVGPVTPGPVVANEVVGRCAIAAAGVSVVITNNLVNADTRVFAIVNQATADVSAFSVVRVSVAAGSFTIFLNAAATAAVSIDWALVLTAGKTSLP